MKNLFLKLFHLLQRFAKLSWEFPSNIKEFGVYVSLWIFFNQLFPPGRSKKYQKVIYHYIRNLIKPILENYDFSIMPEAEKESKKIIWFCWLQGKNKMPSLVRACYMQLEKNIQEDTEIIFLSYENIDTYVSLPNYIKEKHKNGIISMAHFSDIIRYMVVAKYGGVWLDSTIYTTKKITAEWFECDYYTCKMPEEMAVKEPCKGMWTNFLFGGKKSFFLYFLVSDCLLAYWKVHNKFIDYIMLDYILLTIYNHNQTFKNLVQNIPNNNENIWFLWNNISSVYSDELWEEILKKQTFYKLSHHIPDEKLKFSSEFIIYKKILQNSGIDIN